ncbi:MAG: hypothetical protein WBW33_02275 [Bryobacteraceae bacterium]
MKTRISGLQHGTARVSKRTEGRRLQVSVEAKSRAGRHGAWSWARNSMVDVRGDIVEHGVDARQRLRFARLVLLG